MGTHPIFESDFDCLTEMKRRELERFLSQLSGFEQPKLHLEQYVTDATIASDVLYTASVEFDDIEDALVVDLGAGAGAHTAAALYCGAGAVIGIELDPDAIAVNIANRAALFEEDETVWEVINGDVCSLAADAGRLAKRADCVIMNPPFGTKDNAGIDVVFLQAAANIAKSSIYSLHKSSTRNGLKRKSGKMGLTGEVIAALRYQLPKTYKHQRQRAKDIEVDLWRFDV